MFQPFWRDVRPTLINRRAREYYGHREDFQRIARRVGSPDNREKLLENLEADFARDQQVLLIKRQMLILKRIWAGVACALCAPVLLYFLDVLSFPWMSGALVGILFILFQVGSLAERRRKLYEGHRKAHLEKHADSLRRAGDRDIELTNRIEEEWDAYCIDFSGYPPDWKYRVMVVLERDGHTCTQCGWPNGVKRKVRQLHVHHVERHSRGGNHAFSNLVTLCDICHREQEGPGHSRVRPRRRKKR